MCGIAGFKGKNQNILRGMIKSINHRGPNETGEFVDEFFSLGMARLSIIDLSGGSQPIWNERKNICVFQNGEIYNYQELRLHLEQKGHFFKTNSDTEVIVHLYEEYGYDTPKFLKGMFAFCIYDLEQRKIFIAKDRFGEKPLFYYHHGEKFIYSSEIKSLLEHPEIPRKLSRKGLNTFLQSTFVPEPNTLLENIFALPPGGFLVYQNNLLSLKSYFEIAYQPQIAINSIEEAAELCRPILSQAVERQMISDVPIGAFLSGGIDSSTVVALMQAQSSKPIKTFNVKFEEATYDESPIARTVAKHLGTDHHEIVIPNQTFDEDIFWKIIDHVGYPFPDSSAIPTYLITKEIRKHVTVALSGDGGDELFGGYNDFLWGNHIERAKILPRFFLKGFGLGLNTLTHLPILKKSSLLRQVTRGIEGSTLEKEEFFAWFYNMFSAKEIRSFVKSGITEFDKFSLSNQINDYSFLRQMMWFRTRYSMPLDMLIKVDRMSMANSLEVRAPFLDVDLFEFSAKLPDHLLMNKQKGKLVIRETMKNLLPDVVFNHPKSGFSIPLHHYFTKDFENLAYKLVNNPHPLNDILNKSYVLNLLNEGFRQKRDTAQSSVYKSSHKVWTLVQLYAWVDRFKIVV
jgi:asparagine synthase (glutamine-hydrolysing)